jgi:oxygen-independent coproporphyrinogen-3 oxidase
MIATETALETPAVACKEPLLGNYFVAAYPPFSAWEPRQNCAVGHALAAPADLDTPLGFYVHIPFCQQKCDYCYYLSFIGQTADVVNHYLADVGREAQLYSRQTALSGRKPVFVYFGGGTPSTLTPVQVRQLGNGLRSALALNDVEEITFECAPRSVRPELLNALKEIGVTRISMGVQSFNNAVLKLNGRIHLDEDVIRAYALIRRAGFATVNLDLMVGLMSETEEIWAESVRCIIEMNPDSVTIYQTEIPYNTQVYQDLKSGWLPAPLIPWDAKRARLDYGFTELELAGYTVVNGYAAVKNPARDRLRYQEYFWRGADMLGLGVAAFSYFGGVHFQNEITLEKYAARVEQDALPVKRAYRLTEHDQLVRRFILQLKLGEVPVADFREAFDVDIREVFEHPLQQLVEQNLLTVSAEAVRLTRSGLLCVDRLLPYFYAPQFQNLRYT